MPDWNRRIKALEQAQALIEQTQKDIDALRDCGLSAKEMRRHADEIVEAAIRDVRRLDDLHRDGGLIEMLRGEASRVNVSYQHRRTVTEIRPSGSTSLSAEVSYTTTLASPVSLPSLPHTHTASSGMAFDRDLLMGAAS